MSRHSTTSRTSRKAVAALLCVVAAAVVSTPAAAQNRASMGVTVTVAPAVPMAYVTGALPSFARRASGAIEMRSTLSLVSRNEYTLRVRANGKSTSSSLAGVLVQSANGEFSPLAADGSAFVTRSSGSSSARAMDLVVRLDPSSERADLTAELVAARLDQ